jgi:uncharacterized protein YerC
MYWNISDKERLLEAFELAATNRKLLESFLADLFTEKEMEQSVQRLRVICLLYDGTPYTHINKWTKLSSATIARLSKKLDNQESGFAKIIEKFLSKGKGRAYFD